MGTNSKGPFDLLLEEITSPNIKNFGETNSGTQTKTNFKFDSLLKANNQRKDKRINATGFVEIFDEESKLVGRAVLRNVSASGIAVETHPCSLFQGAIVFVSISGHGIGLGKLKCKVQWMAKVEGNPANISIGFNVEDMAGEAKIKFEQFVKTVAVAKK